MIAAILIVILASAYVIGVFVWDYRRRKQGKPSVFLDTCESEGRGKRLVRQFHKMKAKEKAQTGE